MSTNASLFQHMQAAVDIVADSPHPANKIAATIASDSFALSRTNFWPNVIEDTIGRDAKIGNASGTLHAETACILAAPATEGTSMFITDPPCPNCMKNMAEAGIAKLYIDHKGFDKDWAKRNDEQFDAMSMRIADKAGIDVHVIYRKEKRFEIISRHAIDYKPAIENPPMITADGQNFENLIKDAHNKCKNEPFTLALAKDESGEQYSILTTRHPTIGYTSQTVEKKEDKYSFILQPLNRLLMIAARRGLTLNPAHIYSSRCPTSRELVNFIGAEQNHLRLGNINECRDEYGRAALDQLKNADILDIEQ